MSNNQKKITVSNSIPNFAAFDPPIGQVDIIRFNNSEVEGEEDYVYNAMISFFLKVDYIDEEKTEFIPKYVTTVSTSIWDSCSGCAAIEAVENITATFDMMLLSTINIFDAETHELVESFEFSDIVEEHGNGNIAEDSDNEHDRIVTGESEQKMSSEKTSNSEPAGVIKDGKFIHKAPKILH